MDDLRLHAIHSFYIESLYNTGICNIVFVSEDSWVHPDFFEGLTCPYNYFLAGYSPPFESEEEFVVLICPTTVAKTTERLAYSEFYSDLDQWLWRLCKSVEVQMTEQENNRWQRSSP